MECDNLFYICLIVLRKVYEFIWKESLVLFVYKLEYLMVYFFYGYLLIWLGYW